MVMGAGGFFHRLRGSPRGRNTRQYAGQEALRLASAEDDLYAARVSMGQSREVIEDEAEVFFQRLLGNNAEICPEWFSEIDWAQLKLIRDQWI